jgi:hypothetical protein
MFGLKKQRGVRGKTNVSSFVLTNNEVRYILGRDDA